MRRNVRTIPPSIVLPFGRKDRQRERSRYGTITLLVFAEPVLSRKKSPLAVIAHGKEPMITRSIGII